MKEKPVMRKSLIVAIAPFADMNEQWNEGGTAVGGEFVSDEG